MGVTIRCQRTGRDIDLPYSSFERLRQLIANRMSPEFGRHYAKLEDYYSGLRFLSAEEQKQIWSEYDKKTEALIKNGGISLAIIHFLFLSDCEGTINHQTCWKLYKLLRNENDNMIIGYPGWEHPSTMGEFKQILLDCNRHKCNMDWH